MTPNPPPTATILHADLPVAVCTLERVFLAPEIEAMPENHPDRKLVEMKCLVSRAYLVGDVEGPYCDHECETAARLLLADQPGPPPFGRPPLRLRDHD